MYAQKLYRNAFIFVLTTILVPQLGYEIYHKNRLVCDNFCELIPENFI